MAYTTTCFSGECGSCSECSLRCFDTVDDLGTEILGRAEDLSKFLGKKRVDDIMMDYNRKLKSWCKENGFRNPADPGRAKRVVRFQGKGKDPSVFRLLTESHGAICDDSRCKVAFVNSSDWLHTSTYPNFPIYECSSRAKGDWRELRKIHLCGPCIGRKPSPPEISSL